MAGFRLKEKRCRKRGKAEDRRFPYSVDPVFQDALVEDTEHSLANSAVLVRDIIRVCKEGDKIRG